MDPPKCSRASAPRSRAAVAVSSADNRAPRPPGNARTRNRPSMATWRACQGRQPTLSIRSAAGIHRQLRDVLYRAAAYRAMRTRLADSHTADPPCLVRISVVVPDNRAAHRAGNDSTQKDIRRVLSMEPSIDREAAVGKLAGIAAHRRNLVQVAAVE